MKIQEIIQILEFKGYDVKYGKYHYWDNIPYVVHDDGTKTFLIEADRRFGTLNIDKNLIFNEVLEAVKEKRQVVKELLPL